MGSLPGPQNAQMSEKCSSWKTVFSWGACACACVCVCVCVCRGAGGWQMESRGSNYFAVQVLVSLLLTSLYIVSNILLKCAC
jgi:hypothetical protein